jgi:hypothetical protein
MWYMKPYNSADEAQKYITQNVLIKVKVKLSL